MRKLTHGFSVRVRGALGLGHVLMLLALIAAGCQEPAPAASVRPVTSSAGAPTVPAAGQEPPGGSLAERLKAVQSGQADKASTAKLPAWKPFRAGAAAPTVPLGKGLVVVTAISGVSGDYESMKTISDVSSSAVSLMYSAEIPPPKKDTGLLAAAQEKNPDPSQESRKVSSSRPIDVPDLQQAHGYDLYFADGLAEHFPGTTAISASTEVLSQLHAGSQVEFHFPADPLSGWMQFSAQMLGRKNEGPTITTYAGMEMYACTLHRVEPTALAVPVLLNDQRVELPAVHAMCALGGGEEAHFYFLDQPSNPLTLAFQIGPESTRLQVIKITLPPPETEKTIPPEPSPMEQALAEKKPVEVYSLYFDFNKATIKPESEAVLQQIAGILHKHPDWTLNVSGHTDNIGGDPSNLVLSQHRAAAVKDALVSRYAIAPDRLVTHGYGASVPIETNATLEGRARNRRVELQRQ
jgi:outer membrane protein OmpA-like peptidoglycan-associated protein